MHDELPITQVTVMGLLTAVYCHKEKRWYGGYCLAWEHQRQDLTNQELTHVVLLRTRNVIFFIQ